MKKLLSVFVLLFGLTQVYGGSPNPAPTGLNDTEATDRSITLEWTDTPGETQYTVYQVIIIKGIAEYHNIGTVGADTPMFVVTRIYHPSIGLIALSEFTSYTFVVKATYAGGESSYSNATSATTTHTWEGEIFDCLNGETSLPPKRTELEAITSFTCIDQNLITMAPTEDLSNISDLNLSNNAIEGDIPGWIYNRRVLVTLNLSDNNLTGEIPVEITNLYKLQELQLYNNKLIGNIPAEIGNSSLKVLNLSGNDLTGEIPAEISRWARLVYLNLAYNDLTGTIPSGVDKLVNLQTLDLTLNHFRGEIPSGIDKLINLQALNLTFNNLRGAIPSGIDKLVNLQTLNLNINFLTGVIPSRIDKLVNLKTLDLSRNDLTGTIPSGIDKLVTTSGRAGGLRYEPLKADCFKPPKGRQPRIELTDLYVDLLLLDV